MSDLTELPNIGKELAKRLELAGFENAEALKAAGTEKVFINLKTVFPGVCHNQLYAIEGAVQGIRWHYLTEQRKQELREFFKMAEK